MNKIILLIGLFLLAGCNAPKEVAGDDRSLDFTADWAFRLGDDTAAARPEDVYKRQRQYGKRCQDTCRQDVCRYQYRQHAGSL